MPNAARFVAPIMLLGIAAAMVSTRIPALKAGVPAAPDTVQAEPLTLSADWVAAGPGQIEPISGEHRIYSETPGSIELLLVKEGDRVERGQLLAILHDREQRARLRAAEAEVSFREYEREATVASSVSNAFRDVEDAVARLEADVWRKQETLDALFAAHQAQDIDRLKAELIASVTKLSDARQALRDQEASGNAPRRNRTESALEVARSELGVAWAVFEKTRIRASIAGTVMTVAKLPGDLATPAVDDPVLTIGDVSRLRARVETDATDLINIKQGQSVTIKSDAFPDREFQGRISQLAASVRPRRLASQSNALTPKDTSVDVLVELDTGAPLLPGMRVDAYFQPILFTQDTGGHHAPN